MPGIIDLSNFKKIEIPRPVSETWKISAPFGYINKKFWPDFHRGTDFQCPTGTEIKSVLDGTVIRVTYKPRGGVICTIVSWVKSLQNISISYCHLRAVFPVEGQKVSAGEKIAISGNTGSLYNGGLINDHLHLSVQMADGHWIEPIFKK